MCSRLLLYMRYISSLCTEGFLFRLQSASKVEYFFNIAQVSSSCALILLSMYRRLRLHVWQVFSSYVVNPPSCAVDFIFLCGRFPIHAQKVCSSCAVGFFFMCGAFPLYPQKVSSSCAVHFLFMHRRFPLHVRVKQSFF